MCRSEEDLQRDREEERGRRASLLGVVSGRAGAGRAEGRACVHKRVCVHKCACTGMHRCACHLCARVHARTGVCTQAGCAHKGTCTWGARGVCLCVRVSVHMEGARTGVHARRACARARDMHEWVCLRKRGVHIRTGGCLCACAWGGTCTLVNAWGGCICVHQMYVRGVCVHASVSTHALPTFPSAPPIADGQSPRVTPDPARHGHVPNVPWAAGPLSRPTGVGVPQPGSPRTARGDEQQLRGQQPGVCSPVVPRLHPVQPHICSPCSPTFAPTARQPRVCTLVLHPMQPHIFTLCTLVFAPRAAPLLHPVHPSVCTPCSPAFLPCAPSACTPCSSVFAPCAAPWQLSPILIPHTCLQWGRGSVPARDAPSLSSTGWGQPAYPEQRKGITDPPCPHPRRH